MGVGRAGVLGALALALGVGRAQAAPYVERPAADVEVDWSVGEVRITAIGPADRAAPSPASARGAALARAERAADRRLAGLTLRGLVGAAPTAGVVRTRTLQPDGSWHVTIGYPIDAWRQAATGPRAWQGDRLPTAAIVIDARGLALAPRADLRIRVGGTVHGPALRFAVTALAPPMRAQLGDKPTQLKAQAVRDAELTLTDAAASVEATAWASARVVILVDAPAPSRVEEPS